MAGRELSRPGRLAGCLLVSPGSLEAGRRSRRSGPGFGTNAAGFAGDVNTCRPDARRMICRRIFRKRRSPAARSGVVRVERWTASERAVTVETLGAGHARPAPLRLSGVAGARATAGKRRRFVRARTGSSPSRVPAGRSRVEARFVRTPDRTVGAVVSALGAALAAGVLFFGESDSSERRPHESASSTICTFVQFSANALLLSFSQRPVSSFFPLHPLHSHRFGRGSLPQKHRVSVEQFSSPIALSTGEEFSCTVSTGRRGAGWLQLSSRVFSGWAVAAGSGPGQSDDDRRDEVFADVHRVGDRLTAERSGVRVVGGEVGVDVSGVAGDGAATWSPNGSFESGSGSPTSWSLDEQQRRGRGRSTRRTRRRGRDR